MAGSKKEFNIVLKIFTDLVNNLTEDQFNNLINGTADIKYFEKALDNEKREKYNNLLYRLTLEDSIEKKETFIKCSEELSTKAKLMEFCKYFKIEFKIKDTNDIIIQNIINFTNESKEDILYKYAKAENIETCIDELASKLENIMDIDEARRLINSSRIVEGKSNLIKLSRKLNVFTDREASYETIVDNIIKSVVEAKIRSYTIRKKM